MKILHFDENTRAGEEIKAQLPGCSRYVTENAPYLASPIIALEQPDIIICDYYFKHCTLEKGLISRLRRFKGDVYILTDGSPDKILKALKGVLPRIKIYSKKDLGGLIADIKKAAL